MKIKIFIFILCVIPIIIIYKITYIDKYDYVALGDGLALGWTYYSKIGYGYSDYLRDYLEKNNKLKSFNKSFCSKNKTIKDLIEDIDKNKNTINNGKIIGLQKAITDAELITISIGNNEMSNILKFTQDSAETYVEMNKIINNLNYLFKDIRNKTKEQVVFIGYYSYGKHYNNILINQINQKIKNTTLKYNIIFIEPNKIFKNDIKCLPNSIENYPSTECYKKIGIEIVKKTKL